MEDGKARNLTCLKGLETEEMICKKSGGDTSGLHDVEKLGGGIQEEKHFTLLSTEMTRSGSCGLSLT